MQLGSEEWQGVGTGEKEMCVLFPERAWLTRTLLPFHLILKMEFYQQPLAPPSTSETAEKGPSFPKKLRPTNCSHYILKEKERFLRRALGWRWSCWAEGEGCMWVNDEEGYWAVKASWLPSSSLRSRFINLIGNRGRHWGSIAEDSVLGGLWGTKATHFLISRNWRDRHSWKWGPGQAVQPLFLHKISERGSDAHGHFPFNVLGLHRKHSLK